MISSQDRVEILQAGETTSQYLKREKLQVIQSFNCEKSPKDFEFCIFQWTKLMHDVRGCVAIEFTSVAPQKRAGRRHALALLSQILT